MSNRSNFKVVYNSGLNVWDRSHLSTLSIFYDQVLLPATSEKTRGTCVIFVKKPVKGDRYRLEDVEALGFPFEHQGGKTNPAEFARKWETDHQLLFQEGVLSRLPPPSETLDPLNWFHSGEMDSLSDALLDLPFYLRAVNDEGTERIILWQDHLKHLFRTDISEPNVFLTRDSQWERELLKGLMANSVFRFLLPKVEELTPDQIMEVRGAVAATREGFSMHLQSLSSGVEERIKGGESLQDISSYAKSVVETKLIPDYVEFKRQLVAKRAGFWKKVLDKAGKIFEIDAAPWTPKFYGELLKALGFTLLTGIEEQTERLSNPNQAFQFMRTIEGHNRDLT